MQTAAAFIVAIAIIAGLVGFFRSFWRSPPKRERDGDFQSDIPPGGINVISEISHHSDNGSGPGGTT